jgi:hypothetical protein
MTEPLEDRAEHSSLETRLSAPSARSRGHRSMFSMLENQAEAARHIAVARDRFVVR